MEHWHATELLIDILSAEEELISYNIDGDRTQNSLLSC
jgi:hypothetical protein